jgi:hypothetical protein
MNVRGKVVRFFALLAVLCAVAWVVSGELDFWPIPDASREAERYATAHGLRMEAYLGDFVQEPDRIGSCEVRIEFVDRASTQLVKLNLQRSWRWAGWNVIAMTVEAKPMTLE